jgi:hypothetical protein
VHVEEELKQACIALVRPPRSRITGQTPSNKTLPIRDTDSKCRSVQREEAPQVQGVYGDTRQEAAARWSRHRFRDPRALTHLGSALVLTRQRVPQ